MAQIKFLEHVMEGERIDQIPEKLTVIQELLVHRMTKNKLRVLGIYYWYGQFVPTYDVTDVIIISLTSR